MVAAPLLHGASSPPLQVQAPSPAGAHLGWQATPLPVCLCSLPSLAVVQSLSRARLFPTSWTAAGQGPLSFTISQSLLKLRFIESAVPSNHLILCYPLLLPTSIFPYIRVFSNESVLRITWPKFWSFSISPFNEYSGLIFFRVDWFDLCAVQATLKSPPAPQFESINSLQGP